MGSPNVAVKEVNSNKPKSAASGSKVPILQGPATKGPSLNRVPKKMR